MSNQLKSLVKEIQYRTGKTLAEIAGIIEYSPAYFTDQVNKGTNKNLKEKLLIAFPNKIEGNIRLETSDKKETPPTDDKYIALMEKMIDTLEKDKEWLQGIIDTNLVAISDQSKTALAYQKAWVDYIADRDAGSNPKKQKEIKAHLGKLIHAKMTGVDEMDNAPDGRK